MNKTYLKINEFMIGDYKPNLNLYNDDLTKFCFDTLQLTSYIYQGIKKDLNANFCLYALTTDGKSIGNVDLAVNFKIYKGRECPSFEIVFTGLGNTKASSDCFQGVLDPEFNKIIIVNDIISCLHKLVTDSSVEVNGKKLINHKVFAYYVQENSDNKIEI